MDNQKRGFRGDSGGEREETGRGQCSVIPHAQNLRALARIRNVTDGGFGCFEGNETRTTFLVVPLKHQ